MYIHELKRMGSASPLTIIVSVREPKCIKLSFCCPYSVSTESAATIFDHIPFLIVAVLAFSLLLLPFWCHPH